MKTGSKIALIAAGIAAAFACIKKKGISGIGAAKIPDDYKRDFARRYFEDNFYTLNKVMPVERFIDLWVSGNAKAMANGVIKLDGKKYTAPATNNMIRKLDSAVAVDYYGITFEVKPKSTQELDFRWDDGEYADRVKPNASTIFLHNSPKLNPIIGEVLENTYYSADVTTTGGSKMVRFSVDADGQRIYVTACQDAGNDRDYMGDWDFWFTIGTYKTLEGAKRAAIKAMDRMGYTLDPEDLNKI